MKCPICGKQTLPGAKLCGPCRSALKRAKDDSVWELPPSQRQGDVHSAPARPAQWVLGSRHFNNWRLWALGGGALAVCIVVGLHYAAIGEPAAASAAQPDDAARAIVDGTPPAALQRALPAATQTVVAPTTTSNTVTHADDALVQPPRSEQSVPRAPKTRPPVEPVAPPPATVVEPPPPEPVRVAAPPPPPAARSIDPMQRLEEALGRCRGQDLFSRLGCEYQARATHCQGHWGESPQCPAPTNNDHGQ